MNTEKRFRFSDTLIRGEAPTGKQKGEGTAHNATTGQRGKNAEGRRRRGLKRRRRVTHKRTRRATAGAEATFFLLLGFSCSEELRETEKSFLFLTKRAEDREKRLDKDVVISVISTIVTSAMGNLLK
ncbi:uncharacterized protein EV154DRAFT_488457 [Mucor mucedo]|uniref:uncharacterized protein n=1 Tax=Mucor mucedo TaxID=29922 RepID=UPI00221E3988|nr:uncharacterized protein EV154DRAFT_488457 [Mucor mucedo]KAI7866933.1 hypothetical protein EV154DRAFT_488457 [Mucor mucedo]